MIQFFADHPTLHMAVSIGLFVVVVAGAVVAGVALAMRTIVLATIAVFAVLISGVVGLKAFDTAVQDALEAPIRDALDFLALKPSEPLPAS